MNLMKLFMNQQNDCIFKGRLDIWIDIGHMGMGGRPL